MKQLKRVTIKRLLSWGPCGDYASEKRLLELTGGRKSLTPLQVADLDIPAVDRLWVLLREEIIPAPDLHELACKFAEAALPIYEKEYPDDSRPRAAIDAKRAWLRGEITDKELDEARAAARDAAWDAARAAAWDAAWGAAWAAARDAARAAARDAASDAQVEMVREVLRNANPS